MPERDRHLADWLAETEDVTLSVEREEAIAASFDREFPMAGLDAPAPSDDGADSIDCPSCRARIYFPHSSRCELCGSELGADDQGFGFRRSGDRARSA